MKFIKAVLPRSLNEAKILVFSDWHVGDVMCNTVAIQKDIDTVLNNEDTYCILNGDLMNNATRNSVSDCYAETMPPNEQIDYLVNKLTPIKDKILCITQGNHEARTSREDGVDLMHVVARSLGLSDRYSREGCVLQVSLGIRAKANKQQMSYYFYVTHGSGGGAREGGKINRLADLANIVDVDIYVAGHTHLPAVFRTTYYRIGTSADHSVTQVEHLFVNGSAKLEYGGYGQTKGYKPVSTETPVIVLDGHHKKMRAII